MISANEELSNVLSGVHEPPFLKDIATVGKTTVSQKVQQVAYHLSHAVFSYDEPTFQLDACIAQWHAANELNDNGEVPLFAHMETRVGAASALLGYLRANKADKLVTVIASSGSFKAMEPLLLASKVSYPVVFQIAALEFTGSELVEDIDSAISVANKLGYSVYVSKLGDNSGYEYAVQASKLALETKKPVVHVYSGVRGLRQAYTPVPERPISALGAGIEPYEISLNGDSTLYLAVGTALPFANVVRLHLLNTATVSEVVKQIPSSVTRVVVVGSKWLYKCVNTFAHFLNKFTVAHQTIDEYANAQSEPLQITQFFDSDKAVTARAPGVLCKLLPEANVYTKFDNLLAGGIISSDVCLNGTAFYDADKVNVVIVNNAAILKSVDVISRLVVGGTLAIAASSEEELEKILPAQVKIAVSENNFKLFRIDYASIDTQTTEGWTTLMASEAVIWLLNNYDIDFATSRVVHSLGRDMELVAISVNKIVETLKDSALASVSAETIKHWATIEIEKAAEIAKAQAKAEAEAAEEANKDIEITAAPSKPEHKLGLARAFSFVPFDNVIDESEPQLGANVANLSELDLKKRLVFTEAFEEENKLRPEVAEPFVAKVKQNIRVTPSDYDRHIFELELDITGTGLKYEIGESLGVHAPNNADDVQEFLAWYKLNPDEVVGLPLQTETKRLMYRTVFQVFENHLDLFGKVPKKFYESLAEFATDSAEKEKLQFLASPEGAEELKERAELDFENYFDVLKEFNSAKPSLDELIELISPLKRREYSIASAQHVHPNEVHLLIVVVDWVTRKGEIRHGQCSKYLSSLRTGAPVIVSVKPSVTKLPKDPETPVIMAGLGTGLAPFKAFLEEKMWQRDQGHKIGPVYLFLGSRHRRQEYLYGELFEAYKAAGILTHIGAAFSRDQAKKIYIQHRIQEAKEDLVDAFVTKKGNFYLCGPTWPVPDISEALTEIVLTGAELTGEKVNEATLIEDLKEAERYILEVY